MRFRFIDESGQENVVADAAELGRIIASGRIHPDTMIIDSENGRWQPARDLDIYSSAMAASHLDAEFTWIRDTSARETFRSHRDSRPNPDLNGNTDARSFQPGDKSEDWEVSSAPWRRYFARWMDLAVASALCGLLLGFIFPESVDGDSFDALIFVIVAGVGFPVLDAITLSNWHSSFGKWLLSIQTVKVSGERISFSEALARAYGVIIKGLWLGLPLLSIIPLVKAHTRATRAEAQPWEISSGTQTLARPLGIKVALYIAIVTITLSLAVFGTGLQ